MWRPWVLSSLVIGLTTMATLGCATAEDIGLGDGGASQGGISFGPGGAPPGAGGDVPGTGGDVGAGGTLPGAGGAVPGAGGSTPGAGGALPGAGGAPPGAGGAQGTGGAQTCNAASCPACFLAEACCKPDNSCGCSAFGLPCG